MIGVRNLELLLYLGLVLVKLPILCKMQVQVDGSFFFERAFGCRKILETQIFVLVFYSMPFLFRSFASFSLPVFLCIGHIQSQKIPKPLRLGLQRRSWECFGSKRLQLTTGSQLGFTGEFFGTIFSCRRSNICSQCMISTYFYIFDGYNGITKKHRFLNNLSPDFYQTFPPTKKMLHPWQCFSLPSLG